MEVRKTQKSRRELSCTECGGKILAGDQYAWWGSGKSLKISCLKCLGQTPAKTAAPVPEQKNKSAAPPSFPVASKRGRPSTLRKTEEVPANIPEGAIFLGTTSFGPAYIYRGKKYDPQIGAWPAAGVGYPCLACRSSQRGKFYMNLEEIQDPAPGDRFGAICTCPGCGAKIKVTLEKYVRPDGTFFWS